MIAVSPAARDPVFYYAKSMLGRRLREYWLFSSPADIRPADTFDSLTLATAFRLVGTDEYIENGPISSII